QLADAGVEVPVGPGLVEAVQPRLQELALGRGQFRKPGAGVRHRRLLGVDRSSLALPAPRAPLPLPTRDPPPRVVKKSWGRSRVVAWSPDHLTWLDRSSPPSECRGTFGRDRGTAGRRRHNGGGLRWELILSPPSGGVKQFRRGRYRRRP